MKTLAAQMGVPKTPEIYLVSPRAERALRERCAPNPVAANPSIGVPGMLFGIRIEVYADMGELYKRYGELVDAGNRVGIAI
jgi:hypothetical protein